MLGDEVQQQIPETRFGYAVIAGLDVPDWWRWAQVEVDVASIDTDADEIRRWIRECRGSHRHKRTEGWECEGGRVRGPRRRRVVSDAGSPDGDVGR